MLLHILLIAFAFLFRLIATAKIPLNAFESSLLLGLGDKAEIGADLLSPIESILIRATFSLFGFSDFGARVWPIIAGVVLVAVPYILRDSLGNKTSLIVSLFLAIEPFTMVNSLQIGSNIFSILALAVLISGVYKHNPSLTIMGLLILVLSGRGLFISLLLLIVLVLLTRKKADLTYLFKRKSESKHAKRIAGYSLLGMLALFFLVIFVGENDLASVMAAYALYFSRLPLRYFNPASLSGMLVVLVSYAPIYIGLFLFYVILSGKKRAGLLAGLSLLAGTALLWLLVLPYKTYLDLVWVILPLIFGVAYFASKSPELHWDKRMVIMLIILLIISISLTLSFAQFIYQGRYGLSQVNPLINMITMLLAFGFAFVAYSSFGFGRQYLRVSGFTVGIVLFLIQSAFSLRAAGITQDVNSELLWSGALSEVGIVERIIDDLTATKQFVEEKVAIGIERGTSPQLFWVLRDYSPEIIQPGTTGPSSLEIVITDAEQITLDRKYAGQLFSVDTKPKWIETPVFSLLDYDYWSWLIFRDSQITKTTHTLWYAPD